MTQAAAAPIPLREPGPTVASYLGSFTRFDGRADTCEWPPDVFALTNLVMDHTEAYRFAVSPRPGSTWPPSPGWEEDVARGAREWRDAAGRSRRTVPEMVARSWDVVLARRGASLSAVRRGDERELCEALLTLHAMADETCRGLVWPRSGSPNGTFEASAWELLDRHGSLSNIDSARVRITPKVHSAARGITIRSLSRYLALSYESIDVHWRRVAPVDRRGAERRQFNMLLVPWPLEVEAEAFLPLEGPLLNMDPGSFGFFQFDPGVPFDLDHLERLVDAAMQVVGRIDTVIFPEAAVDAADLGAIEELMTDRGVLSLVVGVREAATGTRLGRNYVHLGVRSGSGWLHFQQDKHHRWCLDERQLRQYHLTEVLDPSRQWWEGIELPARTLEIIDVGGGGVAVPLVCEDLARMDEVADLLRRIGPSLVIALLMDGPQLPQRWPCRYAGVLADEPGSAVLTLSSLGMVARCRPEGRPASRVVAMWSDPTSGSHQIALKRGSSGMLITASVEPTTVWTADGRRHDSNTPAVSLSAVHQLRAQPGRRCRT